MCFSSRPRSADIGLHHRNFFLTPQFCASYHDPPLPCAVASPPSHVPAVALLNSLQTRQYWDGTLSEITPSSIHRTLIDSFRVLEFENSCGTRLKTSIVFKYYISCSVVLCVSCVFNFSHDPGTCVLPFSVMCQRMSSVSDAWSLSIHLTTHHVIRSWVICVCVAVVSCILPSLSKLTSMSLACCAMLTTNPGVDLCRDGHAQLFCALSLHALEHVSQVLRRDESWSSQRDLFLQDLASPVSSFFPLYSSLCVAAVHDGIGPLTTFLQVGPLLVAPCLSTSAPGYTFVSFARRCVCPRAVFPLLFGTVMTSLFTVIEGGDFV